ncbi:hypothetical protein, partial [Stenotrophomonas maltophilia]|uniref:hypothetical protein n=1 Tax=Stenotrophomonas maltophilia TaxID=40324 RepID=UPI001954BE1F
PTSALTNRKGRYLSEADTCAELEGDAEPWLSRCHVSCGWEWRGATELLGSSTHTISLSSRKGLHGDRPHGEAFQ